MIFRVAEVGVLALAYYLGEDFFGAFVIAGLDGQLAQPAQAHDPVWGKDGGVEQDAACGFELPGGLAGA